MIRILHTADWHLGQCLNGYSRHLEHAAFLDWLVDAVVEHEVDALLVAGDVFDSQSPPAEARALFFQTIDRLCERRPRLTSVIIAGNHDHAAHLEAPASLLRRAGAHAVGVVAGDGEGYDLDRHLVPLRDRDGVVAAHALAVPFPHPGALPVLPPDDAETEPRGVRALRRIYAELTAAARRRIGDAPLIATGHLSVGGFDASAEGERPIIVGGAEMMPHDIFPDGLAYVALGHLHKAHAAGRETIRYAGSPLPLSCGERDYAHGVTLVTLASSGTAIERLTTPRLAPMLRVPATGYLRPDEVEAALSRLDIAPATPLWRRPFVQIAVAVEGPAAGLRLEIERIAEKYPLRIVAAPEIRRPQATAVATSAPDRLQDLDPRVLFAEAFAAQHAVAPAPDHLDAFEELLREAV